MAFVHLHVHTEYSLLDGSNKIKEYVTRVKELGMNAAAITDHGNMYGAIAFYQEAKAQGIRPIIGCEVYVSPGSRFDRESSRGDDRYYHLILLAANNRGYANLMKIVSIGYMEGFYYKPRVDFETLEKYHEGLICLTACLAGEVPGYLVQGRYETAKEVAQRYMNLFGKENYYLELQDHGIAEQRTVNQGLMRLQQELGLELVCTNDVHYTRKEDWKAHDVLLCIQTGKMVSDPDRMRYQEGRFYVTDEQEMRNLFGYAPEAVDNTQKIADRCQVDIEFGNYKIPKYQVPDGYASAWEFLNALCEEGFERRYRNNPGYTDLQIVEIYGSMQYELGIIRKMGFVEYILIVWDYINWCRENDCWVGPGRGSAAGSRVCYCTGITNIDPVKYQLLFERFLNPERVSMPDIDVDFEDAERYRAIEYVKQKYGQDSVTQIVTFGTMAARGVIKAVGKAMEFPYAETDRLAKMVPTELKITIDKALIMNPELKELYQTDERIRGLLDMAKLLEGLPNHTSVHAAGVVIYPGLASDYVPLSRANDGSPTAEYNMVQLEELGLLKMDFLGLRTLTVLKDCEKNVLRSTGKKIDVNAIDINDKKVLDYIGTGKTQGIFQLESAGMAGFMKELKPQSFDDIIAGISLYRPGPMDFIPDYIRGKNDPSAVSYVTPELKEILEPTYGCIVYQEQVMQIVQKLAGYTMGQADNIRRAMSKKKQYVIDQERKSFVYGDPERNIRGCVAGGIAEEAANRIYDSMVDFAKYAFNKSHAAAYALLAVQTAWCKFYYPVEFMAALMTSVLDNTAKTAGYLMNCKEMGISVLPPDINSGEGNFTAEGKSIRYGMYAIKGLGTTAVDRLVREREAGGKFFSLQEFIQRCVTGEINKRAVENLIKAGACDSLGANRRQMITVYEALIDENDRERKHSLAGQMSLFDLADDDQKEEFQVHFPRLDEFPKEEMLGFEREVLGIYLSGHPLEDYAEKIKKNITAKAIDFSADRQEEEPLGLNPPEAPEEVQFKLRDQQRVVIGGMITSKKVHYTKTNQAMAFMELEDLTGTVEFIVFPKVYNSCQQYLTEDARVFVTGRVSLEEEKDGKVLADQVIPFTQVPRQLWIRFETVEDYSLRRQEFMDIFRESEGADQVTVYVKKPRSVKEFGKRLMIHIDDALIEECKRHFGEENVKVIEKNIEIGDKRVYNK